MPERASWDDTWMAVADAFAGRSLCTQSRVASVVVTADNRVASVGYNGPPAGLSFTEQCDTWCPRGREPGVRDGRNYGLSCLSVHAEVNAIMRADWSAMQDGTMYGTRTPCHDCVKVVGGSGVARVVFRIIDADTDYGVEKIMSFLDECGVVATGWREDVT